MSARKSVVLAFALASLLAAGCGKAIVKPPGGGGGGDTGWVFRESTTIRDLLAVSFADTLHGWAAGTFEVVHSSNGGRTWARQTQNLIRTTVVFNGCSATDSLHCWIVGGDGSIQWTENGGASWNLRDLGAVILNAVQFIDNTQGWVAGRRSGGQAFVALTLNGGLTWTESNTTGLQEIKSISFGKPYNFQGMAAGILGQISYSPDGGLSWTRASTSTLQALNAIAVAPGSAGQFGVSGGNVGIGGALTSTDAGMTWRTGQPVPGGMQVNGTCMASISLAWIAGHSNGSAAVARSPDGGNSWFPQIVDWFFPMNAICCVDSDHLWVVGDRGAIFSTRGGGL